MACRILAVGIVVLLGCSLTRSADPEVLHIGMVESLMQESAPDKRKIFGKEFRQLIKEFTGLNSVVLEGLSPESSAKQLDDEKWHLGVFHGVEFAWVQPKHPKLKPLVVVTVKDEPVRAVLVVKKDSDAASLAALKGKKVAILERLHCRLFAEKTTGKANDYFAKATQTRNPEEALDGVFKGDFQGAVVDTPALAFYKALQPGRFERFKVAAESVVFPPAVIVYREGCLSEALLKRLKDDMLKVNKSDKGREALSDFRITGFQAPPGDYQELLKSILKAYPAPQ